MPRMPRPIRGRGSMLPLMSGAGSTTIITMTMAMITSPPPHLDGKGIESFVLTREQPLTRDEAQFLLEGHCG